MNTVYENTIEQVRIESKTDITFPTHIHADLEMVYVYSGEIEVTVNNTTKIMRTGDFVCIFPNCPHAYQTPIPNPNNNFALIVAKPNQTGEFVYEILRKQPLNPFFSADNIPDEVIYSLNKLREICGNEDYIMTKAFIILILASLWKHFEFTPIGGDVDTVSTMDITYKIADHIKQNYRCALSLESVSKSLGIGKQQLSKMFSNVLKISFNDYVNTLRIYEARVLLVTTTTSITQIALRCGFENSRTFNRAFKKNCSITPREYREQNKSLPVPPNAIGL